MEPENTVAFGELLRRYRAMAGLSQEALAERSGLSRRGIADLERGARRFPYRDTAQRLATALGLDSSERANLLASGHRPQQPASVNRYALPIEPAALVGRERELTELRELLANTRLLTLTGSGGIGKTRLAQALGLRIEAEYADGGVFVDLAPVSDQARVTHAMAQALGVRETRDRPLLETVHAHVGSRQLLVVLDNCEHVLPGAARLADILIRNCPRLRILATSREALRIHGETAWPVPPLVQDEARALFIERARGAQATLHFTPQDTAVIGDICRRLDGIPLAIELAAVRVAALGVTQTADRLADRLHLLSGGSQFDTPRHQTLRAAIGWSFALLSDQERRLFERLAVFIGGWNLTTAEAVCAWGILESRDVLTILANLVDKSLVVAEDRAGNMRYRLLETIRDYASEQLEASGQTAEARRRHATYFRSLAEAGAVTRLGIRYPSEMGLVGRDHDNMRAALSHTLAAGDFESGLGLCQALGGFWVSQGYVSEGEEWVGRFLEHAQDVEWQTLARSLHVGGRLAEYRGAFDRARSMYERSLSICSAHDDAIDAARALCGLGDVELHQGRYDQAREWFQQALARGRSARSLPEMAQALLSLARVAEMSVNVADSKRYLEESLQIHRQLEDRWGVAYVLNELGQHARRDGLLEQAQSLHEESHVLWRQSGSRMGERAAVMNLTRILLERGSLIRAVTLAQDGLEMCRDMADGSATTARCVEIAAQVLRACGSAQTAVSLLAAATTRREVLGAPVPPQEQHERDQALSAARATLGETEFRHAWEDGKLLPIDEACYLASAALAGIEAARSR